jgi:hypothetical protein
MILSSSSYLAPPVALLDRSLLASGCLGYEWDKQNGYLSPTKKPNLPLPPDLHPLLSLPDHPISLLPPLGLFLPPYPLSAYPTQPSAMDQIST